MQRGQCALKWRDADDGVKNRTQDGGEKPVPIVCWVCILVLHDRVLRKEYACLGRVLWCALQYLPCSSCSSVLMTPGCTAFTTSHGARAARAFACSTFMSLEVPGEGMYGVNLCYDGTNCTVLAGQCYCYAIFTLSWH
jgi:hypothetical protein